MVALKTVSNHFLLTTSVDRSCICMFPCSSEFHTQSWRLPGISFEIWVVSMYKTMQTKASILAKHWPSELTFSRYVIAKFYFTLNLTPGLQGPISKLSLWLPSLYKVISSKFANFTNFSQQQLKIMTKAQLWSQGYDWQLYFYTTHVSL